MTFQTLLFYKYIYIPEAEQFALQHLAFCKELDIKGRILIGDEGINGTVSGTAAQCENYMQHLLSQEIFKGIEFKVDDVKEPSFNRMHVRYRPEIVRFGNDNNINPTEKTGVHLSPQEFMQMKDDPDVIVLDTRNKVEHEVGKFKNAYTLDIDTFRDFPNKIEELNQFRNKKILAYCTGGIRCEKATAYLLEQGFENVYQLHGGIIQYANETGGVDFDGTCYVFDKRLSVEVNRVNPLVISVCRNCGKPEMRMVNCANPLCNEHFVQCTSCGDNLEGACSEECKNSPAIRDYDGTGYYAKSSDQ